MTPMLRHRREHAVAKADLGSTPRAPEVAVFDECDTANLGNRATHRAMRDFFIECGWRVSAHGVGSLVPAAERDVNMRAPVACRERSRAAAMLAPHTQRTLRAIRQRYRMLRLLPRLRRVDAIAVGGGALLTDADLHFPQSLAALTETARLLDKPLLCLGCSAEGAWSARGEQHIRRFLAACQMIAARDEATAARIARLLGRPVPLIGDFCLTEASVLRDWHWRAPRHALAINVCRLPEPWSAVQERYENALVALAHHLARNARAHGLREIRLFTTGTPDDVLPAQRVRTRLGGDRTKLLLPQNLEQLTTALQGSALVVASRLHAAILALAESAPIVGLSPGPKLRKYFSTMDIDQYAFDLSNAERLIGWLGRADYDAILAEQHRALLRAPVWAGRMEVRRALQSVARARTE